LKGKPVKYCPHCGHSAEKEEKLLPFDEEAPESDDLDVKSSVLDELIGLLDGHASKKLASFKKPKAVSVEVLKVGKPKVEEDLDEEEE
jgi:hypothetical protein